MVLNQHSILGWLRLACDVLDFPEEIESKIRKFINRTDKVRLSKELEEIFGGEEWLILQCVDEETAQED